MTATYSDIEKSILKDGYRPKYKVNQRTPNMTVP